MLTRTLRLRTVGIHAVPTEVSEMILSEVALGEGGSKMLSRCARVWKAWTEIALSLLYRRVVVTHNSESFVTSKALRRYKTISLSLNGSWEDTVWQPVLNACPGLLELQVASPVNAHKAPLLNSRVFQHPSLATLKVLILHCGLFDGGESIDFKLIPFQLRQLSITLLPTQESLLEAIVNTSLATLTSLEIRTETISPSAFTGIFAPFIGLIASNLKSLTFANHTLDDYGNAFDACLNHFLQLTTSLSRFSFSLYTVERVSYPYPLSVNWNGLFQLLDAIHAPLQTFAIALVSRLVTQFTFKAIQDALEKSLSLSKLARLELSGMSLVELEKVKGWQKLYAVLQLKGVNLLITDS